jgi:hypothetical protein
MYFLLPAPKHHPHSCGNKHQPRCPLPGTNAVLGVERNSACGTPSSAYNSDFVLDFASSVGLLDSPSAADEGGAAERQGGAAARQGGEMEVVEVTHLM